MANHSQVSFQEVYEGAMRARCWFETIGIPTKNSRLLQIEKVLAEFLTDLEALPPEVVVARWDWSNKKDVYYAFADGHAFARISEQVAPFRSHQLPRETLKKMLNGPLVPLDEDPRTTEARNRFLELDLASKLLSAGMSVTGFDDVRFEFEDSIFIVECKRPFRSMGLNSNLATAWAQLDRRLTSGGGGYGLIAIGMDKLLNLDRQPPFPIVGADDLNRLVLDWSQRFSDDLRNTWQAPDDRRLMGLVLVFRFICHTLPPVNRISTVNYEVLLPLTQDGPELERLKRLAMKMAGNATD